MDCFGASIANKERLQTFFINWLTKTYRDCKPVYVSGSLPGDLTGCLQIINGESRFCRFLKSDHVQTFERIFSYINHTTRVENYRLSNRYRNTCVADMSLSKTS